MIKLYKILFVVILLQVLTGCLVAKGNFYNKNYKALKKIKANNYEIRIVDNREKVDSRKIKIPDFTMPGDADLVYPTLDIKKIESDADDIIDRFIVTGTKSITVQINILEAYQKFYIENWLEVEHVYAKVEIVVKNKITKKIIGRAEGEAWGEKNDLDASVEDINRIYDMALKRAIYEAMLKL